MEEEDRREEGGKRMEGGGRRRRVQDGHFVLLVLIVGPSGDIWRSSGGIWSHLEAFGVIWRHPESS